MKYFDKMILSLLTLISLSYFVNSLYDLRLRNKRSGIRTDAEELTFPIYWCVYLEPGKRYNPFMDVNKTKIEEAVKLFQDHTCLQFIHLKECTTPPSSSDHLIRFMNDLRNKINDYNFSYYSEVPKIYDIKIENNCNKRVGCFLKKIMAYLGFYLTHRRSDRDIYITINEANIEEGYESEFTKMDGNVDLAGTGYDYGSVMHISKFYRKNYTLGDVFNIKPESYELMVGQEYGLSFTDYKIINYRYCNHLCSNTLTCQNGGYQNTDGCYYCDCPNGFKGKYCDEIDDSTSGCGKTYFTASSEVQLIEIKGREKCNIKIKASDGKKIKVKVVTGELPSYNPCFEKHGLEIKHRQDKSLTGLCLCVFVENIEVKSEDNVVLIQYNGDQTYNNVKIEYQEIDE